VPTPPTECGIFAICRFAEAPSILMQMPRDLRQTQPNPQQHHQQRQHDRLQRRHPPRLRHRPHRKRQEGRAPTPERSSEPNSRNVQLPRQQFRRRHDPGREQGADEEPDERDGDGGDDELGYEPEYKFEARGEEEVEGYGAAFADVGGQEAED